MISINHAAILADPVGQVRPVRARSKSDVSAQLAVGWARVTAGCKGSFADAIEINTKTVDRALTGETTPELHTALNSLIYDPTALDEVLALYGFAITTRDAARNCDMLTASGLCNAAGLLTAALADGVRNHRETLDLADVLRPLLKPLLAIVDEADAMKGQ